MEMRPSEMNLGIGGLNPKGVQTAPQEDVAKPAEKNESGLVNLQGDKVEINSALPKNDTPPVKGLTQKDVNSSNQMMVVKLKDVITDPSSHALEAQAGGGLSFLKTLYR